MLIMRSEIAGTRVVAIDDLAAHGARGRNGRPAVFIDDPSEAEAILHAQGIHRGELFRNFCGSGLLFADGVHWRERRRIIQPALPPRDADHHLEDVVSAIPHLVARFETAAREDRPLAINDETLRFTTRVLYEGIFGVSFPEAGETFRAILDYFDAVGGVLAATVFPNQRLDGSTMTEIRQVDAAMNTEIDRIVDERRRRGIDTTDAKLDALGRIIAGVEDRDGVREEMRAMMLAGAETTSNTIGFLLLMLARHPEVRERLEAEIDSEHGDTSYRDAAILETLRLFPSIWFQTREAGVEFEIGDHRFEPDDLAFVATALIHRRPELWPEPDAFRPERFLTDGDAPWQPPHRYAFLPFGGGRHLCLGRHVAMHELQLATTAIIRRFRLDLDESVEIGAELGVVLKPDRRLRFRVSERTGTTG